MKHLSLGIVDYIAFVGFFLVSMTIGIYFAITGRKKESMEQYLMGGRRLSLIPVLISIVVSLISSSGLLGKPAEVYNYGIMIIFTTVAQFLGSCIVAMVIVPLFHPLKLISVNEYLELRFRSKTVRLLGCFTFLLHSVLYVGTVIYGPATAINAVTGMPEWLSILLVALIGTAYTSIGGMRAVVWTDVFQSLVMIGGLIAVITLGTQKVGGIEEVWKINKEWGRTVVNTDFGLTQRWSLVSIFIGMTNFYVATFGINQPCVQRFCALDSEKKSRIASFLNGPGCSFMTFLPVTCGLVAFAYYAQQGCDPISSKIISNQNQIMPYFLMEVLNYPGLPGVFISSFFSASLSTLSSSINSMAAVTWEDLLKPHFGYWSQRKQTNANKIMVVFYGSLCMAFSFLVLAIGGNLIQITYSFYGATIGPMLGLFVLGALIPWANWKGALVGGLSGLCLVIWMMFGQISLKLQRTALPAPIDQCHLLRNVTMTTTERLPLLSTSAASPIGIDRVSSGLHLFYSISWTWFSLIGTSVVVVVGVIVSGLTGFENIEDSDPRLFFPCIRGWLKAKSKGCTKQEVLLDPLGNDPNKEEDHLHKEEEEEHNPKIEELQNHLMPESANKSG